MIVRALSDCFQHARHEAARGSRADEEDPRSPWPASLLCAAPGSCLQSAQPAAAPYHQLRLSCAAACARRMLGYASLIPTHHGAVAVASQGACVCVVSGPRRRAARVALSVSPRRRVRSVRRPRFGFSSCAGVLLSFAPCSLWFGLDTCDIVKLCRSHLLAHCASASSTLRRLALEVMYFVKELCHG